MRPLAIEASRFAMRRNVPVASTIVVANRAGGRAFLFAHRPRPPGISAKPAGMVAELARWISSPVPAAPTTGGQRARAANHVAGVSDN